VSGENCFTYVTILTRILSEYSDVPHAHLNARSTRKQPQSSNFISHSRICKLVPVAQKWAAYEAHNGADIVETGAGESGDKSVEGQWTFMEHFSAWGLQNPAKEVTSKGFRECLVKGIIEDDLPYLFGEKAGMLKLFKYLLPHGISTPSHQTIRRDLDVLYEKLDEKLTNQLQVHEVKSYHICKLIIYYPMYSVKPLKNRNCK
jgi:hypothetical protein